MITAVYSDCYADKAYDYWQDGFVPALDQISMLMQHGLPLQTFVHADNARKVPGMLLVPSAHLWEHSRLEELIARHRHPVVLCGRSEALKDIPGWKLTDNSIMLVIANSNTGEVETIAEPAPAQAAPDRKFCHFSEKRYRKAVSDEFFRKAADKIIDLAKNDFPYIKSCSLPAGMLCKTLTDGTVEIAVENQAVWGRSKAEVAVPWPITDTKIATSFPSRVISQEDKGFTIPIPPRGVTAVRIKKSE